MSETNNLIAQNQANPKQKAPTLPTPQVVPEAIKEETVKTAEDTPRIQKAKEIIRTELAAGEFSSRTINDTLYFMLQDGANQADFLLEMAKQYPNNRYFQKEVSESFLENLGRLPNGAIDYLINNVDAEILEPYKRSTDRYSSRIPRGGKTSENASIVNQKTVLMRGLFEKSQDPTVQAWALRNLPFPVSFDVPEHSVNSRANYVFLINAESKTKNLDVKVAAIESLARLDQLHSKAFILANQLATPEVETQRAEAFGSLARELHNMEESLQNDLIRTATHDSSSQVRKTIVDNLSYQRKPTTTFVTGLQNIAQNDPSSEVREAACRKIDNHRLATAYPEFSEQVSSTLKLIAETDSSPKVRITACKALIAQERGHRGEWNDANMDFVLERYHEEESIEFKKAILDLFDEKTVLSLIKESTNPKESIMLADEGTLGDSEFFSNNLEEIQEIAKTNDTLRERLHHYTLRHMLDDKESTQADVINHLKMLEEEGEIKNQALENTLMVLKYIDLNNYDEQFSYSISKANEEYLFGLFERQTDENVLFAATLFLERVEKNFDDNRQNMLSEFKEELLQQSLDLDNEEGRDRFDNFIAMNRGSEEALFSPAIEERLKEIASTHQDSDVRTFAFKQLLKDPKRHAEWCLENGVLNKENSDLVRSTVLTNITQNLAAEKRINLGPDSKFELLDKHRDAFKQIANNTEGESFIMRSAAILALACNMDEDNTAFIREKATKDPNAAVRSRCYSFLAFDDFVKHQDFIKEGATADSNKTTKQHLELLIERSTNRSFTERGDLVSPYIY